MRIVVGITGGIAAYKAVTVIRHLVEAGHEVRVIPTQNALRFVGAATLEAISKHSVDPDLYTDVADVKHVELGQSADLVIVAPATASFVARTAAGIADDLLSNVVLATKAPILVVPAMHTEMWENPATVANIATLRSRGIAVLEPAVGRLTGSDSGKGRLPEPEEIVEASLALASFGNDLNGLKVLVTAGGTQEPIDAVRFIGNHSSGKQGVALARAASTRGASVHLIGANIDSVGDFEFTRVTTAAELGAAVKTHGDAVDVIVMAAAVADYRVEQPVAHKLKKADVGETLQLTLVQNPDILANLVSARRGARTPLIVGFAAESESAQLESLAIEKLARKGCDLLVANDISGSKVFGADTNAVAVVHARDGVIARFDGQKSAVANELLSIIRDELDARK